MNKKQIKELCESSFLAGKNKMKDNQFFEWFEFKWKQLKESGKE